MPFDITAYYTKGYFTTPSYNPPRPTSPHLTTTHHSAPEHGCLAKLVLGLECGVDELLLLVLQAELPQHLQLALPAQGGVNSSTTNTSTSSNPWTSAPALNQAQPTSASA